MEPQKNKENHIQITGMPEVEKKEEGTEKYVKK